MNLIVTTKILACLCAGLTGAMALAGQSSKVPADVSFKEVKLDPAHRIWIFRPVKGKPNLKRPTILFAPAGTPLLYGNNLGMGELPEVVPYVRAGCIVVAYDLSGPVKENANDAVLIRSIRAFKDAELGIKDANRALTYALKSIPGVDPKRIIAAGHSSAGTVALQVTAADPRITACLAYAPVTDVTARVGSGLDQIEKYVPGFTDLLDRKSPIKNTKKMNRPLFLFHAKDDDNVPSDEEHRYAALVHGITFVEVAKGGHYDSMVHQGVPAGIKWMRSKGYLNK